MGTFASPNGREGWAHAEDMRILGLILVRKPFLSQHKPKSSSHLGNPAGVPWKVLGLAWTRELSVEKPSKAEEVFDDKVLGIWRRQVMERNLG